MNLEEKRRILKVYNIVLTTFFVASFLVQFTAILLSIDLSWILNALMFLTISVLFINGILVLVMFIALLKQSAKQLEKYFLWIIINEFFAFVSIIIIFSSMMTMVNF